jgi:AcrR family transcriptional regulator
MSEHSLTTLTHVPRATPLPLDERRAALIAATEPLLEEFGRDVSTRQIAEAASVAEGTIFRAFATKEALIDATLEEVFDSERTWAELAAIDRELSLDDRLVAAVSILQARLRRIFALFHSMRLRPPTDNPEAFHARQQAENDRLNGIVAELMFPDLDRLRIDPVEAASALRMITFSLTHPILGDGRLAEPRQIVDLVLHGIAHPTTERPPC